MARLLLVEDNEMNRDMLSRRLARKGHSVEVAIDGQTGIDAVLATRPDVVLLDMSLPIKDGWTVAREIRKTHQIKNTKIIALTAHAMDGDRDKAIAAGCNDYDTKPIDLKRLLGKIEAILLLDSAV
jgi:CheY-like chemotaxis protein